MNRPKTAKSFSQGLCECFEKCLKAVRLWQKFSWKRHSFVKTFKKSSHSFCSEIVWKFCKNSAEKSKKLYLNKTFWFFENKNRMLRVLELLSEEIQVLLFACDSECLQSLLFGFKENTQCSKSRWLFYELVKYVVFILSANGMKMPQNYLVILIALISCHSSKNNETV